MTMTFSPIASSCDIPHTYHTSHSHHSPNIMLSRLSKRHLILTGCLFAAFLHLLLVSVSRCLSSKEPTPSNDGTFDMSVQLIRARKSDLEDNSRFSVSWKTPQMCTFFEPVPGGCCGASEQGHLNLVAAWKESWQKRGW